MAIKFNTISRSRTKMYANLYGMPSSGKTFSGLIMATTLASSNDKVLAIDTERRLDIYEEKFPNIKIYQDFTMDNISISGILDIVLEAKQQGIECIVIDSLTTLWMKISKDVEKLPQKAFSGQWRPTKYEISAFTFALKTCGMHVITTSLGKEGRDDKMKPTGEILPDFERPKFEPQLDIHLMVSNKGTITKIHKNWNNFEHIVKVGNIIDCSMVNEIKEWLSLGKSNDKSENNDFVQQINNIKEGDKLNNIFEEIKEMSKEDQRLLFTKKDEPTKKIWKDNIVVLQDRITDYQEMKRLVEKDGIIKDTVSSSDFETVEEPKKGEASDNLL